MRVLTTFGGSSSSCCLMVSLDRSLFEFGLVLVWLFIYFHAPMCIPYCSRFDMGRFERPRLDRKAHNPAGLAPRLPTPIYIYIPWHNCVWSRDKPCNSTWAPASVPVHVGDADQCFPYFVTVQLLKFSNSVYCYESRLVTPAVHQVGVLTVTDLTHGQCI